MGWRESPALRDVLRQVIWRLAWRRVRGRPRVDRHLRVHAWTRSDQTAWAIRWREARDLARLEASGLPLWKPNAERLHRMARARALYR